jgi:predicted DNA-binding ribbon-helix-helix protein
MRTTLELQDPLFARLKARAANEGVTLKRLLRSYVGLPEKVPELHPSQT